MEAIYHWDYNRDFYTKILISGLLFKFFLNSSVKLAKYSIISVMLYMICKTIQKFQNVSLSI